MKPISVVVVDDHPVYRSGLIRALEGAGGRIRVVGEGADGTDAISLAKSKRPDVVLLDIKMRGMDGIEATRAIRSELPQTQVVMLTSYDGEEYVISAIRAGATGYLLKDSAAETIVEGIASVAEGGSCVSPAVARTLFAEFAHLAPDSSRPPRESYDGLSDREVEVLRELALGKTNRQIAEALVLSVRTVENQVRSIYHKLDLGDRAEAVRYAARKGLVPADIAEMVATVLAKRGARGS
jgi:DNA-binding NarL/FixJ family response regulator